MAWAAKQERTTIIPIIIRIIFHFLEVWIGGREGIFSHWDTNLM